MNELIKKISLDEDIKRTFDIWTLDLDIKNGIGERPDWQSLVYILQFDLKKLLK